LSLLLMLIASQPAHGRPAPSWTADALVARNLEARGGARALEAIRSVRWTGHLLVGGGLEIDWTQVQERPNHVRSEITLQGLTQITAWDGTTAWRIDPFGGRREPERIPDEDAKGLVEDAPIDGALLDAKGHGWPIRYLGVDDVDGTPAHQLQISRPNGDLQLVWLDPDAFLEIRVLSRRTEHGVLVEAQTDLGEYEKVAGVYFPFLMEFGPKGAPPTDRAKVQIERADPNVTVDPTLFRLPEAR
jgi:hypothetical protein